VDSQTRPDPALASLGPGMRVAGYLLEEGIGQGGMAVVFRAHEERLNRVVALKLLSPGLAQDTNAQERFFHEAYAAAAVDHPHIVPVHDAGNSGGLLYIATRFVPGGDLNAALAREPGLPRPARVATLISPVASALDAAHQAGLVHRDIKPANILVDSSPGRPEHVYLADFGVSKWTVLPSNLAGTDLTSVNLTGTGMYIGTPDYSAPEQVLGHPVTARTDQYALAVVAFLLLTGERMFRGDPMAVMYAHVGDAPPAASSLRPQLPAAVDDVLWRALAKDPGDRFGSCGEFADSLRAALGLAPYGSLAQDYPGTGSRAPSGQAPRAVAPPRGPASAARQPWDSPSPAPGAWPGQESPVPAMDPLVPGFRPARPSAAQFQPTGPRSLAPDPLRTQPMTPGDRQMPDRWAAPYQDRPQPRTPAVPPARGGRRRSRAIPVTVTAALVAAVAAGSVLAVAHWHVFSSSPSASGSAGPGGASSAGSSNAADSTNARAAVTDLAPSGAAAGADYLAASQGPGHSLVLSQEPAGATSWNSQNVAGTGTTFSVPSVAVSGTTIRVTAEGPGHSLTLYSSEQGSPSWSPTAVAGSGTTFSAPSLAVGGGKVVITAAGPQGSVLLHWAAIGTGNWHTETVAPAGTVDSAPSVVVDDALGGTAGSGTAVVIAARGPDHGVTLYWSQDGTSAWHSQTVTASHTTLGASSLTLDGTTLAIATEGVDHSLRMNYSPSTTSKWLSGQVADPGTTYSAPSMAANGKKVVDVAAQAQDGSLLFYSARRGTSTWARKVVAGAHSTLAPPSVAANGSSSVITAVGQGNVVSSYRNANDAGTWVPARVR
jgi:serine/threonine protein kinase